MAAKPSNFNYQNDQSIRSCGSSHLPVRSGHWVLSTLIGNMWFNGCRNIVVQRVSLLQEYWRDDGPRLG